MSKYTIELDDKYKPFLETFFSKTIVEIAEGYLVAEAEQIIEGRYSKDKTEPTIDDKISFLNSL